MEVTLVNGKKAQKEVKWDRTGLDLNKPGEYTLTGDVAGTSLTASVKVVVKEVAPAVKEVSAINGKQIVVKFNKPVDKNSVIASSTSGSETAGTLLDGVFTINELTTDGVLANSVANADGLTASLSEDGKTLTINADTYFDGRYEVVTKADAISTADGKQLSGFTGVVTVKDTTKPVVTNVSYVDNKTARVYFSEPLNSSTPSISAKYADNTDANVSVSGVTDNYVTLDLTNATANKDVTVTLVGVKDAVGNLVSPNPVTVTVKKDISDTVAPTVSSITRTSATSFDVKFSEAVSLGTSPSITVGSTTLTSGITVDSTDKTLVHVTGLSSSTTGLVSISVAANSFVDFSGNGNALATKIYDFTKETAQPTVQSYSVKTINNVQYLVVDYNENVSPVDAVTLPAYYVNSVGEKVNLTLEADTTSAVTLGNISVPVSKYNPDANGNSKSLKFDLSALSAQTYTVDLPAGLATDGYGNTSVAKTAISFAKGATTPQQNVVTSSSTNGIDYASTPNNNELYVHFTQQLDIASATDVNNYSIEGATVEKAEIFKNNSSDGYIVKLTLAKETVDLSGEYEVTVRNVKGMNATAMNTYTTKEVLTENVAPKITNTTVTSVTTTSGSEATVLTLTFDQNVTPGTVNTADFDLYLKGTQASGVTVATTDGTTGDNKLTVTITGKALSAQDINDGVELRAQSAVDIADLNGNLLNPSTTVKVGL